MSLFNYEIAFSRNIGWVTEAEQQTLRNARVAIGGLGGVGGVHLLTLARLGIARFAIADFDVFEIRNFNRQVGAGMSTLSASKIDVMTQLVQDINPEVELRVWSDGIQSDSIDAFLDGVDIYVDGLDFFARDARRLTFAACERKGIPVVTAAPLGFGTAMVVFAPGGMGFADYFGWDDCDDLEMSIRFLVGLSPAMLQRGYLADGSRVNLAEKQGPSSIAACQLCAGVAAVEVLKILLRRGGVRLAPWASQFDPYRMRLVRTWRPFGYRNPLQRLMIALFKAQLQRLSGAAPGKTPP